MGGERHSFTWEALAQQWFEQEWRAVTQRAGQRRWRLLTCEACPPQSLLPVLVELLDEAHDRPVAELEPVVRELVAERNFVEESGDPVMEGRQAEVMKLYVAVYLRVLERLRQQALDSGAWSNMRATPEMFG
ncbi:MAG: hypothetical protein ACODAQ_03215 [Phycisphaeraceae bacterium]